jgi:hypothetical protein
MELVLSAKLLVGTPRDSPTGEPLARTTSAQAARSWERNTQERAAIRRHTGDVRELGDFLRAKRATISPQQVGLPAVGRPRRVPGLRREEVALLADVGVDHYTRLEQGRATGASDAVLTSIGRALRLTEDEQAYLLALAKPTAPARRTTQVGAPTQAVLDGLTEAPALVLGRRMDVLAWNRLAAALFLDFATLRPEHRNLVRLVFLDARVRSLYADWHGVAADCVRRLRMDAVNYPKDRRLTALVGELSIQDADFRRWWGGHDVRAISAGRKTFNHPLAGPLTLDWQAMQINTAPDQTLVVYTAAPGSADGLRFLSSWAPAQPDLDPA